MAYKGSPHPIKKYSMNSPVKKVQPKKSYFAGIFKREKKEKKILPSVVTFNPVVGGDAATSTWPRSKKTGKSGRKRSINLRTGFLVAVCVIDIVMSLSFIGAPLVLNVLAVDAQGSRKAFARFSLLEASHTIQFWNGLCMFINEWIGNAKIWKYTPRHFAMACLAMVLCNFIYLAWTLADDNKDWEKFTELEKWQCMYAYAGGFFFRMGLAGFAFFHVETCGLRNVKNIKTDLV